MHQIRCANCHGVHNTAREVYACTFFQSPEPHNWRNDPMTLKQRQKIQDLNGNALRARTKGEASDYIDKLLACGRTPNSSRVATQSHVTAANTRTAPQLITPRSMIENLRSGRYAVRPDSNTPYMFIKVRRPQTGKKSGSLIISTQHSEAYKECIVIWPNGNMSVYDVRPDPMLLLIVVDPVTASRNYGRELGRCCSCGKQLTDERSRWYAIGPECEKSWPEIINAVDEEHGHAYYPGCA